MSEVRHELLSAHLPFWNHLRETQRETLISATRTVRYKKGSTLSEAGEQCGVVIVRRGRICAVATSSEGRETVIMSCYAGDICLLAAHCFIPPTSLNTSLIAETEADVLIIDAQSLEGVCSHNTHAESFIRQLTARHFCLAAGGLYTMLIHSPRRRLAAYLCAASDRTGALRVKATHEQMSRHVGTAREVITRTLRAMEQEGLITVERGCILLRDKAALKKLT